METLQNSQNPILIYIPEAILSNPETDPESLRLAQAIVESDAKPSVKTAAGRLLMRLFDPDQLLDPQAVQDSLRRIAGIYQIQLPCMPDQPLVDVSSSAQLAINTFTLDNVPNTVEEIPAYLDLYDKWYADTLMGPILRDIGRLPAIEELLSMSKSIKDEALKRRISIFKMKYAINVHNAGSRSNTNYPSVEP